MINAQQSAAYEAVYESGITGLAGTVAIRVEDNQGAVVFGPTAAAISELGTTGIYVRDMVAPATVGQYTIVWSFDGTFVAKTNATEDLVVFSSTAGPLAPLPPLDDAGSPAFGPCSAWTTEDDVAACCDAEIGSDSTVFTAAVTEASELLWMYSGRVFNGLCQQTVRPCSTSGSCGFQVLSRGYVIRWDHDHWDGHACGCTALDRVLLPGYPVREIVQVLIDGDVVDTSTYRLDGYRWLVRTRAAAGDSALYWPSCQSLDLPESEDGTFAVTYTHGQTPPLSGQLAAQELACEAYKSCVGQECALPAGTTRVARQGIVIEKLAFSAWGLQDGIWRTGLKNVDAFLNSFGSTGSRRRSTVWSPASSVQYARRAG